MSKISGIPSEEEFARASRLMREEARGLDDIAERTKTRFYSIAKVHAVHLLPQSDVDFRAYVFFLSEDDRYRAHSSGTIEEIRQFLIEEINLARSGGEVLRIGFEFDSDENVRRNYDGDYLIRLR